MKYDEALEFIHGVSWLGSRPGLERIGQLLDRLGNPEKKLKFVHVAGTNGKGSTAAMLSSILSQEYNTGLYTSPYIFRFNERIKLNGGDITDSELAEITALVAPHAREMRDSPTEFELVTAIALMYYAAKRCDIVVLETGMGGRLDSTNIIASPECAVITAIGLDHTKELGPTIPLIAAEKAGIIKPGCDVVLYDQGREVADVVLRFCDVAQARARTADFSRLERLSDGLTGQRFRYRGGGELYLPLLGEHQTRNAAVVLETVEVLRERGYNISDNAVMKGFGKIFWPARFEIVSKEPWFIVDGGHNPQCAEAVRDSLKKYFSGKKIVLLMGVMRDKDYVCLTDILDEAASAYISVTPDNPRALPASELASHLERYGKPVKIARDVPEGVKASMHEAGPDGVSCSVGSLYMSGEVRAQFGLY